MHRTMIATSTLLLALATHAAAQDWPPRPMTLVVPFSAGGGVDVSARIQAQRMGELLAATGDEPRRPLDPERDRFVELRSRLVVARHEPRDHARLRLAARLREPALHEQNVEPLLHLLAG